MKASARETRRAMRGGAELAVLLYREQIFLLLCYTVTNSTKGLPVLGRVEKNDDYVVIGLPPPVG
jgi:hypothetical protein